jgi:hypothetical protein
MKRLTIALLSITLLSSGITTAHAGLRPNSLRFKSVSNQAADRKGQLRNAYGSSSSSSSSGPWKSYSLKEAVLLYPDQWEPYEFVLGEHVRFAGERSSIFVFMTKEVIPLPQEKYDEYFLRRANLDPVTDTLRVDWYMPSFSFISSRDDTLLAQAARRYSYTAESGSKPVYGEAVITAQGRNVYIVSMISSSEADFQKDAESFAGVIASLRLNMQPSSARPAKVHSSSAMNSAARKVNNTKKPVRLRQ